jgi:hypothetical protein
LVATASASRLNIPAQQIVSYIGCLKTHQCALIDRGSSLFDAGAAAASVDKGTIMKREIERRHMARNGCVRSAFIVGALVGTIALSSAARADQTQFILDFNLPDVPLLPFFRYQSFDSYLFVQGAGGQTPFVNWIALGAPEFNADGLSADLAQTAAGVITICRGGGCPGGSPVFTFNFTSIGLASATNDRTGGQVAFVFDHPDGTFDTSIVTLKPGMSGLQTFSFNEQNGWWRRRRQTA